MALPSLQRGPQHLEMVMSHQLPRQHQPPASHSLHICSFSPRPLLAVSLPLRGAIQTAPGRGFLSLEVYHNHSVQFWDQIPRLSARYVQPRVTRHCSRDHAPHRDTASSGHIREIPPGKGNRREKETKHAHTQRCWLFLFHLTWSLLNRLIVCRGI